MLHRKELTALQSWHTSATRKPLIIRGARQIGKSTLVRAHASQSQSDLIELNLERNPEYAPAFQSNDPKKIIQQIEIYTGNKIVPGKSILFIDEIQDSVEALQSLRYFYEEIPELHVISAGSMLEFTLSDRQFSMPVGRISYFFMGCMDFEEFIQALGDTQLLAFIQSWNIGDEIPPLVHQKALERLSEFYFVGGMPEAVARYSSGGNINDARPTHFDIINTYQDDIRKYATKNDARSLIQSSFRTIPGLLGQKVKFSAISQAHRSAEVRQALDYLSNARLISKIHRSAANGVPLSAEEDPKFFKALFLDIGLASAMLGAPPYINGQDISAYVNKGSLAEQFVGQHLLYQQPHYVAPSLHYWAREKSNAAAEIDYLIQFQDRILPIEVKSGKTGRLRSLHQYLSEKKRQHAVRFCADIPSLLADEMQLSDKSAIEYQLLSLPLYMVGQTDRLVEQLLNY